MTKVETWTFLSISGTLFPLFPLFPATNGHTEGPQRGQQRQKSRALEELLIAVAVQHKSTQPGGRALADAHPATPRDGSWGNGKFMGFLCFEMGKNGKFKVSSMVWWGNIGNILTFCGINWRNLWEIDVVLQFDGKI